MHLKRSSGKWRPYCLGRNVLTLILKTCLSPIKAPQMTHLKHTSCIIASIGTICTKYINTWSPTQIGRHFACDFPNYFLYENFVVFCFQCHLKMIPMVQWLIYIDWFRTWLGSDQATRHKFNQKWPNLQTHVCFTRPRWVKSSKRMLSANIGRCTVHIHMFTPWHGDSFRMTGPLWGWSSGERWTLLPKGQWCGYLVYSVLLDWLLKTVGLPAV